MLRQGGKRRDGLDRTIREWRVLGHSKREEMLFRQRPDPIQGKIAFPSARPSIRPGLDPGLLGTRGGRSHTRQRSSPWVASDQSRSESLIIPVTHCYSLRKNLSSKSAKPKTQDQSSNRMQIFSIPGPSLTAFGNGLPFSSFQTNLQPPCTAPHPPALEPERPARGQRHDRPSALFAEQIDDPQADDAQPVPDGVAAGRQGAAGPA